MPPSPAVDRPLRTKRAVWLPTRLPTCDSVAGRGGSVRQPAFPDADERSGKYWTMLKLAYDANGRTDRTVRALRAVAASSGCKLVTGPMKKDGRALEKARLAYERDYSQIKDYFRVSLVADTVEALAAAAAALAAPGSELRVLRVKNRLSRKYDADMLSAGYRDVQMVCTIPGASKLLVEVQLHLRSFFEHNSKAGRETDAAGLTGHQRYIKWRERKERERWKFQERLKGGTM